MGPEPEPEWTLNKGQKVTTQIWIWSWIQIQHWPPKNWLHFGTHMVIKTLDGSSCKKLQLVPQLHISGIHVKKFKKKRLHDRKWNWPIMVSRNTYQFNLWRSLYIYIKRVGSKLSFKAIKIALKSKKYGLYRHKANNIEINKNMGSNVQFWR